MSTKEKHVKSSARAVKPTQPKKIVKAGKAAAPAKTKEPAIAKKPAKPLTAEQKPTVFAKSLAVERKVKAAALPPLPAKNAEREKVAQIAKSPEIPLLALPPKRLAMLLPQLKPASVQGPQIFGANRWGGGAGKLQKTAEWRAGKSRKVR